MPLEAIAINNLDNNPVSKNLPDLKTRIQALYSDSTEFDDPEQIISIIEKNLKKGNLLYLGMFNSKPIATLLCCDDAINQNRRLQYLAVHTANRGRGIAKKFVKQVTDIERKKGITHFTPVDKVTHHILSRYELLSTN